MALAIHALGEKCADLSSRLELCESSSVSLQSSPARLLRPVDAMLQERLSEKASVSSSPSSPRTGRKVQFSEREALHSYRRNQALGHVPRGLREHGSALSEGDLTQEVVGADPAPSTPIFLDLSRRVEELEIPPPQ